MRCTILVLSLAIIYATASPIADDVIPEDSLYSLDDDLSEAQAKVDEMTAAGRSDKDCRKLVTDTRTGVTTNVANCQKIMDALPRGQDCPNQGQGEVKKAKDAKSKADKHVIECKTKVTATASASVSFGSRTFSSLTEGKCSSFYSSATYTTAEANYNAAVTAHTKAVGAAGQADKDLKAAIDAAAKAKHECECKTKSDHESLFATHSAADKANQDAWTFANKVECVLDGKGNCPAVTAPKCKRPTLTAAVNAAQCAAKKMADSCPHGYVQIGTKTKNNDVGGSCLGQTFGKTKAQCEADCNARKDCVSFMYGGPAQMNHKAGKCELCNHKNPNNSWGIDFIFCRKGV